jgi:hypothetical protein
MFFNADNGLKQRICEKRQFLKPKIVKKFPHSDHNIDPGLSKAKADFVAGVQGACRIGIWS